MPTPAASPKRRRYGLSLVEAAALCLVAVALTIFAHAKLLEPHFAYSTAGLRELEPLKKFEHKDRASRGPEELIIRDYFQDRRDGVFLDVGANHYRDRNNTYYLETQLGWSGIAVDALQEFAPDYATHRPRTRFVAMFASDVVNETVKFFVPDNNLVASSDKKFTERYGAAGTPREVPTTTLTAVLDQAGIAKLDLLSMDIELAEPKALAGFDIQRFRPAFVCIEGHPEVRQQILDYFARNNYVLVGKYLRMDPDNIYFQPLR